MSDSRQRYRRRVQYTIKIQKDGNVTSLRVRRSSLAFTDGQSFNLWDEEGPGKWPPKSENAGEANLEGCSGTKTDTDGSVEGSGG
jgi:hypothetical protein